MIPLIKDMDSGLSFTVNNDSFIPKINSLLELTVLVGNHSKYTQGKGLFGIDGE